MRIGMTTTVPVEVIYAAGHTPVDLNNIFVEHPDPVSLVRSAEFEGFPRNSCSWLKGMYTLALRNGCDALLTVTEGDCSNTKAMAEALTQAGLPIIPFAYPHDRKYDSLEREINKLIDVLGTNRHDVDEAKKRLDKIRRKIRLLDERAEEYPSYINHYYQVCSSDFCSDPDRYEERVDEVLANPGREAETNLRIGYIGVPPIFKEFYSYMDSLGVLVCFNEVQRQFSMPFDTEDITEQYLRFTYPYDVFGRIEDIKEQSAARHLDGIIHYTQSFCYRQIQDMVLRANIDLPILTVEGDIPAEVDNRTKIRLESFVEMLEFRG